MNRGSSTPLGQRIGPWLWLLPALVLLIGILVVPGIQTFMLSLTNRSLFDTGGFIGFGNFVTLAASELFWRSFRNNIALLLSVPLVLALAAAITGILFRRVRASAFYESLIFLPYLPAVAAVGSIFIYLLGPSGPINNLLTSASFESLAGGWLTDADRALWSVLGVMSWKRLGFTVLLLMASTTTVDESTLEAAAVDGASWSRTYVRVVLPQIRAMVIFAGLIGVIEVFSYTFSFMFVLTRGGPNQATFTLDYLLYDLQFIQQLTGLASAVAVVLIVVAASLAVYRVRSYKYSVGPTSGE